MDVEHCAVSVRGVGALHEELERAKTGLKTVDETLKKLIGRDPSEPRHIGQRRVSRGGLTPGLSPSRGGARIFAAARRDSQPGPPAKRPAIFSRLGHRRAYSLGGRQDSDEEEESSLNISVHSSVVATYTEPQNRNESIEMQQVDERGKARNKRMFGLLMGTLQRFKSEESQQGEKDKLRRDAERRVEQKAREEKDEIRQARQALFLERKHKQQQLKNLEHKLELVDIHEQWEVQTRQLMRFIRTKSKPPIFFLPKEHTPATDKKLAETTDLLEQIISERRTQLEEEIEDLMAKDEDAEMTKKADDSNKSNNEQMPDDSVNDEDIEMAAELGEGNEGLGLCDTDVGDESMLQETTTTAAAEGKVEKGKRNDDSTANDKENGKEASHPKEAVKESSKDAEKDSSRKDRSHSERRRHTSRDRSRRSRERSRHSRDRSHRHSDRSSQRDRRGSEHKAAGDASQKSADRHRTRHRSGSERRKGAREDIMQGSEKDHEKDHEKQHGKEHDKEHSKEHDKEHSKEHSKEHNTEEKEPSKEHAEEDKSDDQHKDSEMSEKPAEEADNSTAMDVCQEAGNSNDAASFLHDLSDIPAPPEKIPF